MKKNLSHQHKLSIAGVIVSLGIIYGDIGTSPLYVMSAIIGKQMITKELIFGGVSAVFWTITLLTTIKYVLITLQADNNGEGGIFSLFALIKRKRKKKYFIWIAILGGSMLLADGIITPPISISSAIEGLIVVYPEIQTIPIVITIIILIFLMQQLGTSTVGKSFGPIMMLWFGMLAFWGIFYIIKNPTILYALSPHYAIKMLFNPKGFWLLGAIFLCTTGAEALYSDLGHVGKENIRISWIFVKTALILNYFGQGVWLLQHEGQYLNGQNITVDGGFVAW
jgi:KUP system potassium uptake protein